MTHISIYIFSIRIFLWSSSVLLASGRSAQKLAQRVGRRSRRRVRFDGFFEQASCRRGHPPSLSVSYTSSFPYRLLCSFTWHSPLPLMFQGQRLYSASPEATKLRASISIPRRRGKCGKSTLALTPPRLQHLKTHFIPPRYKIGTLVRCPSQPPPPASCGVM